MFSCNLSSEQTEAEYLLESGLFQMQNQVNKFSENNTEETVTKDEIDNILHNNNVLNGIKP